LKILTVEQLVVKYGSVVAVDRVGFDLEAGQSLTLLGPSGCGKTTLLRSIAGLEQPTSGRICLYGEPVFDGSAGVSVPTEKRNLSMMFQSYAIWPHMTVFDNVAYGLKLRHTPKAELHERVMNALELVGLTDFANRPSPNLSGGQQQRVALARSFVFNPRLILFDEALSNLDARLRTQMRVELKALQAKLGIAAVFVTHDQEEALVMSDKILVMRDGQTEQIGGPLEVYLQPTTAFVADFVGGSNVVKVSETAVVDKADAVFEVDGGQLVGRATRDLEVCRAVAIKTVHVHLATEKPDGRNVFQAVVEERHFVGDFVAYVIRWGNMRLRVQQPSVVMYERGASVWCRIDPAHVVPLEERNAA